MNKSKRNLNIYAACGLAMVIGGCLMSESRFLDGLAITIIGLYIFGYAATKLDKNYE